MAANSAPTCLFCLAALAVCVPIDAASISSGISNVTTTANVTANASANATSNKTAAEAEHLDARQAGVDAATAADLARKAAQQTVDVVRQTQLSLDKSRRAVHDARATTEGLSERQRELLKGAEAKLRDATNRAEYGRLEEPDYLRAVGNVRYTVAEETRLRKLEKTLQSSTYHTAAGRTDNERLSNEVRALRKTIAAKREESTEKKVEYVDDEGTNETSDDRSLEELDADLKRMEDMLKRMEDEGSSPSNMTRDELKAEIERLREMVRHLHAKKVMSAEYGSLETVIPSKARSTGSQVGSLKFDIPQKMKMAPLGIRELGGRTPGPAVAYWRPQGSKARALPGGPDWASLKTGYQARKAADRKEYIPATAPCDVTRVHAPTRPCGANGAKTVVGLQAEAPKAAAGGKFLA